MKNGAELCPFNDKRVCGFDCKACYTDDIDHLDKYCRILEAQNNMVEELHGIRKELENIGGLIEEYMQYKVRI